MAPNAPADERRVSLTYPMPIDYTNVLKGNVFITANCRKRTHEAGRDLYVVVGQDKKVLGLRCPTSIFYEVLELHLATAGTRAAAVMKRDRAVEGQFERAILMYYPKIPEEQIPRILRQTLKKRAGRVGRTKTVKLEERVDLAVRAHIRHCRTDYDKILRQGASREEARKKVIAEVNKLSAQWRGSSPKSRSQRRAPKSVEESTVKETKAFAPAKTTAKAETNANAKSGDHAHHVASKKTSEPTKKLMVRKENVAKLANAPTTEKSKAKTKNHNQTPPVASKKTAEKGKAVQVESPPLNARIDATTLQEQMAPHQRRCKRSPTLRRSSRQRVAQQSTTNFREAMMRGGLVMLDDDYLEPVWTEDGDQSE